MPPLGYYMTGNQKVSGLTLTLEVRKQGQKNGLLAKYRGKRWCVLAQRRNYDPF
jgi:hypothetical protein